VHHAGHDRQRAALAALLEEVIPVDYGQLLKRDTPVEGRPLGIELLLQLLVATLLDLVGWEGLEVVREAHIFPQKDAPLGRVVLVPLDGVAVVGLSLGVGGCQPLFRHTIQHGKPGQA
jgi:hypothetical protein